MTPRMFTVKLTQEELRRLFDLLTGADLTPSDEDIFLMNYIGAMALHTVKFTPGVLERVDVSSY